MKCKCKLVFLSLKTIFPHVCRYGDVVLVNYNDIAVKIIQKEKSKRR